MAGVTVQLGRTVLVDGATVVLALAAFLVPRRFQPNSAWLVLGGATAGVVAHSLGLVGCRRRSPVRAVCLKSDIRVRLPCGPSQAAVIAAGSDAEVVRHSIADPTAVRRVQQSDESRRDRQACVRLGGLVYHFTDVEHREEGHPDGRHDQDPGPVAPEPVAQPSRSDRSERPLARIRVPRRAPSSSGNRRRQRRFWSHRLPVWLRRVLARKRFLRSRPRRSATKPWSVSAALPGTGRGSTGRSRRPSRGRRPWRPGRMRRPSP